MIHQAQATRPFLPPPPSLDARQCERIDQFDADPYEAIRSLALSDAYACAPDHYLDINHPDHEPNQLARYVTTQVERTLIDLVNNCDSGEQFEIFMSKLRNRYAGVAP